MSPGPKLYFLLQGDRSRPLANLSFAIRLALLLLPSDGTQLSSAQLQSLNAAKLHAGVGSEIDTLVLAFCAISCVRSAHFHHVHTIMPQSVS